MATNVRIPPLRFFTQRVLPAVYTDELSYYEVLAKVVDKLNELIDVVGDSATIEQIQQVIKDIEKELSALTRKWREPRTIRTTRTISWNGTSNR